ncbi:hypothetical protein KAZ82_01365 [Candidatus Babeliales bacterium]|nr:hypothetical protein [Candidatus Babeliales bacterium]
MKQKAIFWIFYLTVYVNIINTSPVSITCGGTSLTACQAYAILCGGTSSISPLQSVSGLGTSGDFLTSNGASSLPSFQTKSGELVLITQSAVSSASITFDNTFITSSYSNYLLIYTASGTWNNNSAITLSLSTDNGSTFLSTNYQTSCQYHPYNSTTITNFSATTTATISRDFNTLSTIYKNGFLYIFGLGQSASTGPWYFGNFLSYVGSNNTAGYCYGINTGSPNVNCIKLTCNTAISPTIVVSLYGIKQ